MANVDEGPCGSFRFQVTPSVVIGVVHLQRLRPWPHCTNPDTGNQWSQDMKEKIFDILERSKFDIMKGDLEDGTQINNDKSLRRAIGICASKGVDVILAIQPVISDGRLAPVFAQEWQHPIVFFATPEEQTGEMISGNSLVGSHLMSATLKQLGFKLELVYANLDWALAEAKLHSSVRVAFALRYLKHSKIGLIGYQAPGFQDFHPNPFLLCQTFGSLLLQFGITEYVNEAKAISQEEVKSDVKHVVEELGLPFKPVETGFGVGAIDDIEPSSRHYLAMKKFILDHNLDALAIRCWPELPGPEDQGGLDQWCYMALARLASEGFPIACEGDVDGAFGCLVGKLLGCGAIYLSDWLEHDQNTLTLWHGGMAPFQLSEAIGTPLGPCISRHFNNRKVGCLDATVKIGIEVTVYRFWVINYKYHLIALEGRTIRPKRHLLGNNGLVQFGADLDLTRSFDEWVQLGFPHHVCVIEGRHANRISSLAKQCGVKVVKMSLF